MSHFNHRCQRYKVSIMLRTSLARWEIKRKNYWEDELHLRDQCGTKHDRHFWYPSWRNFESDCDGLRTSRSHLNHRCQRYKVSIMLKKSRSPRSSMEGFCPWKELLSISWFEQLKSLVWWESKRNNCKILVHRRVNQEAMPVGTDRHLGGEWRLCSCRLHLPMPSTLCIHWNDDNEFVCSLACNRSSFWDYCDNTVIGRRSWSWNKWSVNGLQQSTVVSTAQSFAQSYHFYL